MPHEQHAIALRVGRNVRVGILVADIGCGRLRKEESLLAESHASIVNACFFCHAKKTQWQRSCLTGVGLQNRFCVRAQSKQNKQVWLPTNKDDDSAHQQDHLTGNQNPNAALKLRPWFETLNGCSNPDLKPYFKICIPPRHPWLKPYSSVETVTMT